MAVYLLEIANIPLFLTLFRHLLLCNKNQITILGQKLGQNY